MNSSGRNGSGSTPTPSSIKRARFLGRRLAADRARRRVAFVDRARFFGKFRADVVGIGDDLLAQLTGHFAQALLAFIEQRDRRRRRVIRLAPRASRPPTIAGAMIALETRTEPQSGQAINPRLACVS